VTGDVGPAPKGKKPRRWRRWLWRGVVIAGLVALYLCRAPLLTRAAGFLDVSEPPERVDYVMVLGGDINTRPFVAAALYRKRLAGQVLLPVMKPARVAPEIEPVPCEVLNQRVLHHRGVPDTAILLLKDKVGDTNDEAEALALFLAEHPGSSVAVVTTTYHTRRTRGIFQKKVGNLARRLLFVAAPAEDFDAGNWWHSEAGLKAYLNEYAKWVYYQLRY
jgi:uncharacterized SAM-binding protein YcdF (DUF218 family)